MGSIPKGRKRTELCISKAEKLKTIKLSSRLVTCSFDKIFLQQPASFISALATRLDGNVPTTGRAQKAKLPDWVPLQPPLIMPVNAGERGPSGQVPLPNSVSWQRYTPHDTPDSVDLIPSEEPEVVIIILSEGIKQLCANTLNNENTELNKLGSRLNDIHRPVSVIFFAKPALLSERLHSVTAKLQIQFGIKAVYQFSDVQDLATLISNYTKSIAERPYKAGRLEASHSLSYVTATVPRVLALSLASRGSDRRLPSRARVTASAGSREEAEALWGAAVRAWVHRVWLAQLGQWRGVSGDIATALASLYYTPRQLYSACWQSAGDASSNTCSDIQRNFIDVLTKVPVRRGAGVLASENRLGSQIARRIATFFTSEDPFDDRAS